ncbi:MAG: relaxase domain-containing protein [Acidimicrobiia bacterium]|nr:relaxase domain-containing protein [Acidimicrobiia bacterium]
MLNIGRIRPGGAEYYVGEIALSAEAYYLGRGEAPGRWVGSLAEEMGLQGEVDPDHFRALLEGKHPFTAEQLVAAPRAKAPTVSEAPEGAWLTVKEAAAQLDVSTRFTRRLLATGALEGEKARSDTTRRIGWRVQRAQVNAYATAHKPSKRRPGFDLTLRPPKSVSILWALADPERRAAIRQAHREAVDEVVRYYEAQATMARSKGERIQTAGLVAAAFDHRSSRAGDPLLHTHVVVANLTLTVADAWRTLEGRLLFHHALSGGYLYQAHLRHLLTERLGIEWGPIVHGLADIDGVPQRVIDEFSQRRDEIEELLAESGYTSARARQAATLATRNAKDRSVDPDALANTWRERAAALGFDERAIEACFDRAHVVQQRSGAIERTFEHLAGAHGLTERASTFTRRDVVQRLAAELGSAAPAEEVERLADRFIASDRVVLLAGPTSGVNSQVVIGLDNRRILTGGTAVFSTPELVEIETRLLQWAEQRRAPGLAAKDLAIDLVLTQRPDLTDEQVTMVRAVCSSSEAIQPIVGRPGSGKTYAASACVDAFALSGTSVAGCAVSATAAAELESAVGFRHHTGRSAQTIASLLIDVEQRGYRFASGTVLLLDEASMVGTRDLARLASHVDAVGGCIKLIGDPDQHASVDTGGVFKALAARKGSELVRLVGNRRQIDPIERAAIDDYREGRIDEALDRYDLAGKIVRQPTARETYDALVQDWWADRLAGSAAPMLTGTNAARRALNTRARTLLKAEGVLMGEPLIAHGREFMVGDEVVARRNDRALHASGRSEFVKNGSTGWVAAIKVGRREIVVEFMNEGPITIPAEYLDAGHIEHAYARTTHGVQGATLDRARYHPTDVSRFEEGYVAITRAAERTSLYIVEGDREIDDETGDHAVEVPETGLGPIAEALARRGNQIVASEIDPLAVQAAHLAQRQTLRELRERARELDAVLGKQPPSVADQLTEARRGLSMLAGRRARMTEAHAAWRPSRRRAALRPLASIDEAITHADQRVGRLEGVQHEHEAFAADHAEQFAERKLVNQALASRRLTLAVEAVADPPLAIIELLGTRPSAQRERLCWDRAAESIRLYLDESAEVVPEHATTIAELIGSRPRELLARYRHDQVAAVVRDVIEPTRGRSLGRSIGAR